MHVAGELAQLLVKTCPKLHKEFLIEEENGMDVGFNKAISSDITMKMKNGELYNLIYKKSPNSITIPIEKIEEENKILEGFIWKIKEKPEDKKDIIQ